MTLKDRLLAKRIVTEYGCWEWTGYRMPFGYGQIGDGKKVLTTHRAAYIAFVGEIPDELFVCHRCDNPPCFNPAHLFLGTHRDNMRDAKAKKRSRGVEGMANVNAKLTDEQVGQILDLAKDKSLTYKEIAKQFNITSQYVGQLANGQWRKYVKR